MDLENEYDDDNLLPHITVDDDPRPQVVPQNGLLGSSSLIVQHLLNVVLLNFIIYGGSTIFFFFLLQVKMKLKL